MDPECFDKRSFQQRPIRAVTTQTPWAFLVLWVVVPPNYDSSPSYVWSLRKLRSRLADWKPDLISLRTPRQRAIRMPIAEIFQVLNTLLAEHRAKENWLGVVSALLVDDQHWPSTKKQVVRENTYAHRARQLGFLLKRFRPEYFDWTQAVDV